MAATEKQALADIHVRETARDVLPHRRVLASLGEIPGQRGRERRGRRVLRANSEIHYRRDWHLRLWYRDERDGGRR